jgi:hypothetical protein
MAVEKLTLIVQHDLYGVCRLSPSDPIPDWSLQGEFFSVSRTAEEISIVCTEMQIPSTVQCERGWRMFRIAGMLDFALIGIVAGISAALASAQLGIFVLSTYNTDYILVKQADFSAAVSALQAAGYEVLGA